MASSATEQILDLKRQAIALKEAGDTNGAMVLLAQARDLEFENASIDDLWDVLKLKQFAVVMKKRGDLDAARQALIKAKQIEKEGLAPPPPEQQQQQQSAEPLQQETPAPAASQQDPVSESPPEPAPAMAEPAPAAPAVTESTPVVEESPIDNDDDDLRELMQLDEPNNNDGTSMDDVAFSIEEMADHEMMTEFKLGGMPVPSEEEYQAKILECKKAALAAKKAGDLTLAVQELGKSKQLEKVRLALSQIIGDGAATGTTTGENGNEVDDSWMYNLNAEESELLGELLPKKQQTSNNASGDDDIVDPTTTTATNAGSSSRIEDVLEELAGFLEDPALFMDALDMGMEVPSVEEVKAKAEEHKMMAVEHKKASNLEGAKAELIKSKQFTAHAVKLKAVLEHVERKKGGGQGDANVKLEDLEAMLEADEKKGKEGPKVPDKELPAKATGPAEKTSDQLKEEAIKLRDQKKIKEASEVLKLYKAALKREQDAAEMARRKELVRKIRKEIDFAQHQIRIFEYYQRFCDPDTQQVAWWKEYVTRCNNVSKVIMTKGAGAIKITRKKTTMMSARQEREEEEDFNSLVADLLDRGTNSDPPDERLEITIQTLDKIQENSNLQKLFKKQKRENLPEHPAIIRLEVHVQLPPNERDTEKSIELVYEPASKDPLKKLELTTTTQGNDGDAEAASSTCVFEKSQYVDLVRGKSPYGKIIRKRIERNKKITISAYHVPVAEKKGWFFGGKKNKEELPDPTLLGKVVVEMHALMTRKVCAAGEFPLMNGSGTKELGGILKLAVRTGVPFMQPGERDDLEEEPNRTKLESYTAMVFTLNQEQPSTAAEI